MKMDIVGGDAVQKALKQASTKIKNDVANAVFDFGTDLHQDIVLSVQRGPATGTLYQKTNPRRVHRASAPGQAPMSDTGRLASSIYFQERSKFYVAIGTKIKYANWLEYGTRKMLPRPFFKPAFDRGKAEFRRTMERILGSALR